MGMQRRRTSRSMVRWLHLRKEAASRSVSGTSGWVDVRMRRSCGMGMADRDVAERSGLHSATSELGTERYLWPNRSCRDRRPMPNDRTPKGTTPEILDMRPSWLVR